ncbi:MAG TPA: hypothetical protein VG819_07015 [Rhizomicrobium sp.]|jgi:hypothetical protein|nr:hypothetical protein [Rhizomicrobium sp.]
MDDLYAFWLIVRNDIHHIHPVSFFAVAGVFGLLARGVMTMLAAAPAGSAAYVLVNAVLPTMTDGKPFALPHMTHAFWHFFMSLSLAMVFAVGTVYGLKTIRSHIRG